MVCLIIMDAGAPDRHPVPVSWLIRGSIEELLPEITFDDLLFKQIRDIAEHDIGRHDLFSKDLSVQVFLLVTPQEAP